MVRYDAGIHSNSGKQVNSCQFDLVSSRDLTDINMNTSIFILILLVTVCSTAPVLSPGKGKESAYKQVSLSRVSVKRSKRLCSQRDTWVHSSKQFGSSFFLKFNIIPEASSVLLRRQSQSSPQLIHTERQRKPKPKYLKSLAERVASLGSLIRVCVLRATSQEKNRRILEHRLKQNSQQCVSETVADVALCMKFGCL